MRGEHSSELGKTEMGARYRPQTKKNPKLLLEQNGSFTSCKGPGAQGGGVARPGPHSCVTLTLEPRPALHSVHEARGNGSFFPESVQAQRKLSRLHSNRRDAWEYQEDRRDGTGRRFRLTPPGDAPDTVANKIPDGQRGPRTM